CRAQSALIKPARTRRREGFIFTASAAHLPPLLLRQARERERAALPAESLVALEDVRRVPALRARGRVRARLDALRAARRANARIEERERRVRKQVKCVRKAHLKRLPVESRVMEIDVGGAENAGRIYHKSVGPAVGKFSDGGAAKS